ncbi:MAG: peptidoglycan-binding protein [bacterium]|nr:peptidoglycan-binding protein [bacterium]
MIDIKSTQRKLSEIGFNLVADGVMGAQTREEVRRFQEVFRLAIDGVVGPKTAGYIDMVYRERDEDREYIAPELFDYYKTVITALPGKFPKLYKQKKVAALLSAMENGKTVLVSIRTGHTINLYNDILVVLCKTKNGKYCREYKVTTDPGVHWDHHGKNIALMSPQIAVYFKHNHQQKVNQPALGKALTFFVRYKQFAGILKTPRIADLLRKGAKVFRQKVGLNIHWGDEDYAGTAIQNKVGQNSLGCQVICCNDGVWAQSKIYRSFLRHTFFRKDQDRFLFALVEADHIGAA